MPAIIISDKPRPEKLLSPEVQDLISYHPHWIIRKGNILLFLIGFALLGITWFVKYPDILYESMRLVSIDAPARIVVRTDSKLQQLLVSNEQEVTQGEILAFLQSTGSHRQVLSLLSWIRRVEPFIAHKDSLAIVIADPLPQFNELGELQSAYQEFENTLKETTQLLSHGYYRQKEQALEKDISFLTALQTNTRRQQEIIKQDYELQRIEYQANESLAADKVIAPLELNQDKSKVLSKEQSLRQMTAQYINGDMATHNKEKEILDLQKYTIDQEQKLKSGLFDLKSRILDWMLQYVVTSPVNGKVLFTSFLQENEQLSAGQELFYIQQPQTRYYGQMMASQSSLGKIHAGQKVLISVASYPSAEFGYLTGSISYIPSIPTSKDSFLIKVDLPQGLRTNYHKLIFFRNDLFAQAGVITDNRRLFDRFIEPLKAIH